MYPIYQNSKKLPTSKKLSVFSTKIQNFNLHSSNKNTNTYQKVYHTSTFNILHILLKHFSYLVKISSNLKTPRRNNKNTQNTTTSNPSSSIFYHSQMNRPIFHPILSIIPISVHTTIHIVTKPKLNSNPNPSHSLNSYTNLYSNPKMILSHSRNPTQFQTHPNPNSKPNPKTNTKPHPIYNPNRNTISYLKRILIPKTINLNPNIRKWSDIKKTLESYMVVLNELKHLKPPIANRRMRMSG